ncbi:hypothetical protein SKC41_31050, partial [Mycobacterium sp. 050128]|uniref:hypothetical protein n=1 Tax=Mycobacterium sp. 050128 TaxID=3096112 RepID=UPI002EDB54DF
QQHRRRPALLGGATRVGNFDERQWGISVSAVNRGHHMVIQSFGTAMDNVNAAVLGHRSFVAVAAAGGSMCQRNDRDLTKLEVKPRAGDEVGAQLTGILISVIRGCEGAHVALFLA